MKFVIGGFVIFFGLSLSVMVRGDQIIKSPIAVTPYPDGRPVADYRLEARDQGVVLRHGGGTGDCDAHGARDVSVFEHQGRYYLHYAGAGPKGWLACLATSEDLTHWDKKGAVLELGATGRMDAAAAASPCGVYFDGHAWQLFYMGTPNVTPSPDNIPMFPYVTMKARSKSPSGPWEKQYDVVPFSPKPDTFYTVTASPGGIVRRNEEFLMFFSGAIAAPAIKRTLGIARTRDLNGPWNIEAEPIVPLEEQVENSSLYFERQNKTWFLFTDHIGLGRQGEFTDAIWVYWSKDLNHWNTKNKAVVLDGRNCTWSKQCIGMPSVIRAGNRLAVLYDAPEGDTVSHMNRDVGLAWLQLPLIPPKSAP